MFTVTATNSAGAVAFGPMSVQDALNKALDLASRGFTDIMVGNATTGAKVNIQQFMREQGFAQGS